MKKVKPNYTALTSILAMILLAIVLSIPNCGRKAANNATAEEQKIEKEIITVGEDKKSE